MAGAGDGLRRLAQRAERMEREWPTDAADLVERAVTGNLRSATGDGALSHGRRLGRATVAVRRRGNGASVEADGSAAVWTIVERGTKGHTTNARPGGWLRTPYGPRASVTVQGAPARRVWSDGVAESMPRVRASAERAFAEVVG